METRAFGRSGLEVSVVGFGAWAIGGPATASRVPIGWGPSDDGTSMAAIARAVEVGITFFDTADFYGLGRHVDGELKGEAMSTCGVRARVVVATMAVALALVAGQATPAQPGSRPYYPPAGSWAHKTPEELGMDAKRLSEAVAFAQGRESTRETDFSDQERIFGSLLGSVPTKRAKTNGLVVYKGYVVAEFGDTTWVDPTYSVAKSMMASVAGIAVRHGKIVVDDPVGRTVKDGGYDSPHNAPITWKMHLQQESEWAGEMWGKKHDFVGHEAFGEGERKPRELQQPGTFYEYNDVRINRLGLSLLRTFEKPVPEVFRDEIMEPIGASNAWKWVPYHNSYVGIGGRKMASVSGGTRWGGGVWIHSWDMARFGYLWLRGGTWGDRQILPPAFVKAATTPSAHGPDYGYLWWLNTQGKNYPGLPANVYGARGAGSNTITISPDHDLVVVWRWHRGNEAEFVSKVIAAIRGDAGARSSEPRASPPRRSR